MIQVLLPTAPNARTAMLAATAGAAIKSSCECDRCIRVARLRGTFREDLIPSLRTLLRRRLLDAGRNGPDMPSGVHEPSDTIAPELILRRHQDGCAALRCTGDCAIHIGHVHEDDNWRAAVRRWGPTGQGWPFGFDHHHFWSDPKQCMRQCSVRTRALVD